MFTIGKLVPLAVFIAIGIWFADFSRLTPLGAISLSQASATALLLIFSFGGYDVIGVPAGEAANPRRHVPFAFIATIVAVTRSGRSRRLWHWERFPIFTCRRRRWPMRRWCSSAPPARSSSARDRSSR
jgi:hypothetical protein